MRSGVVAKLVVCHIGVRANYGYAFQIVVERKSAIVFEQNHALTSHFAGHGAVVAVAHDLGSLLRVDVRVFKQTHLKFLAQHVAHGAVDVVVGHFAFTIGVDEVLI